MAGNHESKGISEELSRELQLSRSPFPFREVLRMGGKNKPGELAEDLFLVEEAKAYFERLLLLPTRAQTLP